MDHHETADSGFLAITDIARELRVSTMTVRRDLHALQAAGEVRLVHGGAILRADDLHHRAFPDDGNARPGSGSRGAPQRWSEPRTRSRWTPGRPRTR